MTNVINLDPVKTEMIDILRQKIADVSAGLNYSLFISKCNNVYGCGDNSSGQ